ncbi:MAG: hypothetical protein QM768_12735 [Agriterribacter sp.]
MKRQKTIYRFYTALFLLLSFAATQLPFELFHTHNNTGIVCIEKDSKDGFCHHKSHLGSKERFCWACTIQVEKIFDLPDYTRQYGITGNQGYTIPHQLVLHHTENFHIFLRGPPSLT